MRLVSILLLCGAVLLWAGDDWRAKAPADWSRRDVERLLQDSPWARVAEVSFAGDRAVPIGSPQGRTRGVGFPGGGGMPNGGWGGPFGMRAEYDASDQDVIVRWRSALPIRLALARTSGGDTLDSEAGERFYIVEVSVLPSSAAHHADDPDRLRQVSRLVPKGRSAIRARVVDVRPQPGAPGVVLYFPRDDAITLADKSVEFEMTGDDFEVRSKFKLKEMEYSARLEL